MVVFVLFGFLLPNFSSNANRNWLAWLFTIVSVATVFYLSGDLTAGQRMLALIFSLFIGLKTVSVAALLPGGMPLGRWLLYSLGWVGMQPIVFMKRNSTGSWDKPLILRALGCLLLGFIWLLTVEIVGIKFGFNYHVLMLSWPAFVFIFHGGIFPLLGAMYRQQGFGVSKVMDYPLAAKSLGNFWGARWNVVYIAMLKQAVFKPLAKKMGSNIAFIYSFLVSGVLHEVALTLPLGRGFGLPTLYFLLQAFLVMLERRFAKGRMGRFAVVLCLILPLPLLFTHAFLGEILRPFMYRLSELFPS